MTIWVPEPSLTDFKRPQDRLAFIIRQLMKKSGIPFKGEEYDTAHRFFWGLRNHLLINPFLSQYAIQVLLRDSLSKSFINKTTNQQLVMLSRLLLNNLCGEFKDTVASCLLEWKSETKVSCSFVLYLEHI